jgi:hypothetical protein
MTLLLIRLFLAPLCVIAVSLAGRRWGVAAAGVLGGLPVVGGPILLALTLLHDREFGSEAAAGTLLGLGALTVFGVVYGYAARRFRPEVCLPLGWAGFLAGVAVLSLIEPPPGLALAMVCAGFLLARAALPDPHVAPAPAAMPPRWDLPARGLAAMALVMAVTAASGTLGPNLSGLLAPFPIAASVLAAFTHAQRGYEQAVILLRNLLIGYFGFAAFCFTVAVALPGMETGPAFALALVVTAVVQTADLALRRGPVARFAQS